MFGQVATDTKLYIMDFLSLFQKKNKNAMWDRRLGFQQCIQNKGSHCSPREGVEGGAPLPGDFRVIVCPTPPQMNDFCDLLGTPDAPVSKIVSVKTIKFMQRHQRKINCHFNRFEVILKKQLLGFFLQVTKFFP